MCAVRRDPDVDRDRDQRVYLHGVSWEDFERLLEMRGDCAGPRVTYLRGELELMSPSRSHERFKKMLARLLEAYAEERGIPLNGYGSWTLRNAPRERAAEPDECYVVGPEQDGEERRPDIAIEVVWTHGGLDKLVVYAGLGVREVWVWEDGVITVHRLEGDAYRPIPRSEVLPDLDLEAMARHAETLDQGRAVAEWRAFLRSAR